MRGLLMVGAARIGEPYLAAARRLGFRVTLVESTAHQDRLAGEVDRFIPVTGTAEEHWAAAAQAAAGEEEPDGVLAFAETQVMAAALVQDRLGLPGPSLRAAVISRNKALQRAHFAAACLPQPDHLLVDNVEDAVAWAESRLPVVVKPLSLSGSRGVVAVGSTAELAGLLPERLAAGKVLLEQQARRRARSQRRPRRPRGRTRAGEEVRRVRPRPIAARPGARMVARRRTPPRR